MNTSEQEAKYLWYGLALGLLKFVIYIIYFLFNKISNKHPKSADQKSVAAGLRYGGLVEIISPMEPNLELKASQQNFKLIPLPQPLSVVRAITKLGADLSLARRRRRISQSSMAERMGASLSTVRRMEAGDGRVPLHFIARALFVLGEVDRLAQLLDTSADAVGLTLMDEQLPRRIRMRKTLNPNDGAM